MIIPIWQPRLQARHAHQRWAPHEMEAIAGKVAMPVWQPRLQARHPTEWKPLRKETIMQVWQPRLQARHTPIRGFRKEKFFANE